VKRNKKSKPRGVLFRERKKLGATENTFFVFLDLGNLDGCPGFFN
jgi:hypothetical protein